MLEVSQIRRTCAHILKHASLRWAVPQNVKPAIKLTWILPGWEASDVVCVANRAEAEGCSRGASLLKGSCNFHSRVLLKLVLRLLPHLNTLLPSCPVRPSTPQLQPHSAAAAGRLAAPFQITSFTSVNCTGRGWRSVGPIVCMCEPDVAKPLVLKKTRIFWLLKSNDYRCGYGVYFFYAYN